MKTKILLSALLTFAFLLSPCKAQVPQGFNYQAIARDGSGNPITGATIKVKLSILSDTTGFYASGNGTYIWEEEHTNVKTNAFGLFTVVFGDLSATKTLGNVSSFSAINWMVMPLYIGTKIANPTTYKNLGSAKLWSVPYSMVAGNLEGTLPYVGVSGNTTTMDSALFVVRNNTGQIVFAVYNDGVRIYVNDVGKGATKGGFAIGGFGTSKGTSQPLFVVDPDSIRGYIDDNGKSTKGGFAIGSFGTYKTLDQKYFTINNDSIRMYINDLPTKSTKGGFAIGGFGTGKGPNTNYLRVTHDSTRILTADTVKGFGVSNLLSGKTLGYLRLTPSNYFIGQQAGQSITSGLYNSIMGYQAGYTINTGNSNSFIGYRAGYTNSSGNYNSFFGDSTGYNNTTGNGNTFLGGRAGYSNTTGFYNTASGGTALFSNTSGVFNTAIGYSALYSNQSGSSSTAIGLSALESNTTGDGNTSTGSQSLQANTTGYFNTADGYLALYENNGSCNTATGNRTLLFNITGNYNTGTGSYALFNNNGSNNTATGFEALYSNTTGGNNTVTGNLALYTTTGSNNTAFGYNAGYYSTGSGDVFIGYQAGYNETGSNKLYIDDSNTSSPLIWGDFSARLLNFNGNVGIGTTTPTNPLEMGGTDSKIYMNSANSNMLLFNSNGVALPSFTTRSVGTKIVLYPDVNSSWVDYAIGISNGSTWYSVPSAISTCAHRFFAGTTEILTILGNGNVGINNNTPGYKLTVNGTAWCSSGAWTGSDIRWKKNINEINDVLNNVLTLKPVTYQWKTNEFPEMNFTDGTQIGLIAQDVEKVFPSLVMTDNNGYKAVSYEKLSVVLLEGIKEQQKQIEGQQQQIESTKQENQQLRTELDELKTLVNTLVSNQTGQENK